MFAGSFTAWGTMQLELTGNRPPVAAIGIASINNEGIVFKTKPGQAEHKRYRWSEFSKKGLETLLSQLPAERAFLQKNAQTKILYLDFIRAEILAQTPKPLLPVQAPIPPPVVKPVNPARIKSTPKAGQAHHLTLKSATIQNKNNSKQGDSGGEKISQFNLVPGPAIPSPPSGRLSPINWLNPGGMFALLILAGLSAYAGHEIAVFRHRPVKTICALSALLPVIVPLIVLFLPDPAEAHAQAMAEANDRFLLGATATIGTVADDYKMSPEETHIEETGTTTGGIDGSVVMERYQHTENHFSDRFFSDYFGRFYQASPPSGQSLVIQTPEVIYPVHHISKLEPESFSVMYAQGQEWVEESIDYRLIEEVRVETSDS